MPSLPTTKASAFATRAAAVPASTTRCCSSSSFRPSLVLLQHPEPHQHHNNSLKFSLWTGSPAARLFSTITHASKDKSPAAASDENDDDIQNEEEFIDEDIIGDFDGDEAHLLEDEFDAMDDEDVGPEISTGGAEWGEKALEIAREMLPVGNDLQLFSFRVFASQKRMDVRLDKLSDQYGSPTLDDVEEFSREFSTRLEAALGAELADTIELEVSSAGAERVVTVPSDLPRFSSLPMRVVYTDPSSDDPIDKIYTFVETTEDGAVTKWKLADVRLNKLHKKKGQGLNKKERETVIEVPTSAIQRVNLHVDI